MEDTTSGKQIIEYSEDSRTSVGGINASHFRGWSPIDHVEAATSFWRAYAEVYNTLSDLNIDNRAISERFAALPINSHLIPEYSGIHAEKAALNDKREALGATVRQKRNNYYAHEYHALKKAGLTGKAGFAEIRKQIDACLQA